MHAALIREWGQAPTYVDIDTPEAPGHDSEQIQVKVTAVGVHRVVRSRASGKHYSSKTLPHMPGTDGCGTLPDGQAVYFSKLGPGTFSQYVNVPKRDVFPLPAGADPVQFAALVNPAFSSWMALTKRCTNLPPKFIVLIMGATSASGAMAAYFARVLGASKVIGCGRNAAALAEAGLDESIVLQDPIEATDFSSANGVDVILDYTYGSPTQQLLTVLKPTRPVQFCQIGSLAGGQIAFPADILRSKDLTMRGSGFGSWTPAELSSELPNIISALAGLKPQKVHAVLLKDIETAWDSKVEGRLVFLL